jgi:hypothetical protein
MQKSEVRMQKEDQIVFPSALKRASATIQCEHEGGNMDERVRISLWMVGGAGFGAVLGGVFGGLTGVLHSRSGRWVGTPFGRSVADAFSRMAEREQTHVRQGTIAGAADGFLFLGILGTVSGTLLGISRHTDERLLGSVVLGSLFLAGGAVFFGSPCCAAATFKNLRRATTTRLTTIITTFTRKYGACSEP